MLEDQIPQKSEEPAGINAKWKKAKVNLRKEFKKNREVAIELRHNAEQALHDIKSGKVLNDDEAARNLKNTLVDTVKAAGMTGIFLLPGGSIGLIALRKMLKSKEARTIGIENLLTLTVEEAHRAQSEHQKNSDEEE
jgi:hypothetical protein